MKALSWINFILGLWLIVAGFTLAAGSGAAMTQDIVLGIIIAAFAVWAATSEAHPVASWIVAIAGLWTLISPGVTYGMAHAAHTNDIIVGIVVLILGFANAVFRRSPVRTERLT
jgi:hypothetical protein